MNRSNPQRSSAQIFTVPALLALVSAGGLVSALVGDGVWNVVSWIAVGLPLVVIAWCIMRPSRA